MSITHTTAVRVILGDAVCNSSTGVVGANGKIVLYSGTALAGTIAVTNGSASIVGTSTAFTTALVVGQHIVFVSDTTTTHYVVSVITDNTHVTLTANYTGTTYSATSATSSPLNAQASLVSNTAVSTITGLNFGANSAGVSTVTSSTADSSAVGGIPMFFRIQTSGSTNVFQGSVTTTGNGGDMTINSITIGAAANVSLTGTNTYTAPV